MTSDISCRSTTKPSFHLTLHLHTISLCSLFHYNMSSKFFTWAKGDRNTAAVEALRSGRIVPIPVECIKIKGLDFACTEQVSDSFDFRNHTIVAN